MGTDHNLTSSCVSPTGCLAITLLKGSGEGSAVAGGVPSSGPRPVLTLVLCPDLSATGSVVEASGRVPTQPTQY